MVWTHSFAERLIDKILNHLPGSRSQITIKWVVFNVKLGPDDQMVDVFLNAIRPVVADDFDIS